jgi:hypothetical protein
MSYIILFVAILFILALAYSSIGGDDYDFRDEFYKSFSQQDYANMPPGVPPFYNPYMPFDPRKWYEAEMLRQRQNFNNGFKVAVLVVALIMVAYLWGKYF